MALAIQQLMKDRIAQQNAPQPPTDQEERDRIAEEQDKIARDKANALNYGTYNAYQEAGNAPWTPDMQNVFSKPQTDLQQYQDYIAGLRNNQTAPEIQYTDPVTGETKTKSYTDAVTEAGSYDPTKLSYWNAETGTVNPLDYKSTDYAKTNFNAFSGTKDPVTGETVGGYQAPDEYNAFQYQTPEIAAIKDVNPVSDALWNTAATTERERIGQQFADTEAKMKQAAIQSAARPEQMAALLANQGVEQAKAQQQAQNQIDMQRAQQGVGIAQATQGLEASKGSQQAQLEAANQESQAQEIAKKYGLDIDAARYMVTQKTAEQTAQAAENQFATTYGQGEERFKTGLEQQQREQEQLEKEKQQLSKEELAKNQITASEAAKNSKEYTEAQAANQMLQGQQAGSQTAAQQGTVWTNLTEGERNEAKDRKLDYANQWANAPAGTKAPTTQPAVSATKTLPTAPVFAQSTLAQKSLAKAAAKPATTTAGGTNA